MVFMGQADPLKINIDEVQARLDRPDYAPVVESLREIGFSNAMSLFATYTGRQSDLGRWFGKADVTTDRDLRLMYQAGWGINSYLADPIYREMLRFRQPPQDIFSGNPAAIAQLLDSLR
jgi:spermidine synthase